MRLRELQEAQLRWELKNFPVEAGVPDLAYRGVLGVCEEAGELAHAQLKGEQHIRHTPREIIDMKLDAVGDIVIYLAKYCNHEKLDLELAVERAWARVQLRDWSKDPMNLTGHAS